MADTVNSSSAAPRQRLKAEPLMRLLGVADKDVRSAGQRALDNQVSGPDGSTPTSTAE